MYVFMYVHMYILMSKEYVCMYVCIYANMNTMFLCMHVFLYIYICMYVYLNEWSSNRVLVLYVCMYVSANTYRLMSRSPCPVAMPCPCHLCWSWSRWYLSGARLWCCGPSQSPTADPRPGRTGGYQQILLHIVEKCL